MAIKQYKQDLLNRPTNIVERGDRSKYFQLFDINDVYGLGIHIASIRGSEDIERYSAIQMEMSDEFGRLIPIKIPPSSELSENRYLPSQRFSFEIDNSVKSGVITLVIYGKLTDGRTIKYIRTFLVNKTIQAKAVSDRGEWASGIDYSISDVVQFGGSSYISILDNISDNTNIPPDTTYWRLFAESQQQLDVIIEANTFSFNNNFGSIVATGSLYVQGINISSSVVYQWFRDDIEQVGETNRYFTVSASSVTGSTQLKLKLTYEVEDRIGYAYQTITNTNDGELGLALLYQGLYDSGVTYNRNATSSDVVYYDTSYYTIKLGISSVLNVIPTDTDYWEEIPTFKILATDLLLAQDVTIRRSLTLGDASIDGGFGTRGVIKSLGGYDSVGDYTSVQNDIVNRGLYFDSTGSMNLGGNLVWDALTKSLTVKGNIIIEGGNAATTSSVSSLSSSLSASIVDSANTLSSSIGNVETQLSSSISDVYNEALQAQTDASNVYASASIRFSNIADDNIADYSELPTYKFIYSEILADSGSIIPKAIILSATGSALTNYTSSFDNLSASLSVIINTEFENFPINGINDTPIFLQTNFDAYYLSKNTLLGNISEQARNLAEAYSLLITPTDPSTGILKNNPTPSGQGLFMNASHLGFYNTDTWQTFMSASGEFYLTSSVGGNYLFWNPITGTLEIQGAINITGGNGATQDFVNNTSASLSSSVNGSINNLSGSVSSSLSSMSGSLAYDILLNSSSFALTSELLDNRIFTNADGLINKTPNTSSAGLYLGSNYLGYYADGSWITYMDNQGDFYLTGSNGYLVWSSADSLLGIKGNIIADTIVTNSGSIAGWELSGDSIYKNGIKLQSTTGNIGLLINDNNIDRLRLGSFDTINPSSYTNLWSGNFTDWTWKLNYFGTSLGTSSLYVSMVSSTDGLVITKNKLRGDITFVGNIDIGSLDIEDTMEISYDVNGLISLNNLNWISPQTNTVRYIISSSVYKGVDKIDSFTHELDSSTQYFSKKIRDTYYNDTGVSLDDLTFEVGIYLSGSSFWDFRVDISKFTIAINKATINITPDQALFYASPTNYFEWTKEKLTVKTDNFETNTISTGDLVVTGQASFLGGLVVSGSLDSHPVIDAIGNISLTNGNVIRTMTFDEFGHVEAFTSYDLDNRYYTETESDAKYFPFIGGIITGDTTFNQNVTVNGNLAVMGTYFTASVEQMYIEDNILTLNYGESGSVVTSGFAGIEIDRGIGNSFWFVFDETRDRFVVGLSGSTQVVSTREDSPIANGMPWYDNGNNRLSTTTGFTFDGTNLNLPQTASLSTHAVRADRTISTNNGIIGGGDLTLNRTFGLTGNTLSLHELSTNGILVRTGTSTITSREILGTNNQVIVSNGNGISGNPQLSLPQDIHISSTPTFSKLNLSGTGDILSFTAGNGLSSLDGWINIGNGVFDWKFGYQGSTSNSTGNEFKVWSTGSQGTGKYFQFDHDGNFDINGTLYVLGSITVDGNIIGKDANPLVSIISTNNAYFGSINRDNLTLASTNQPKYRDGERDYYVIWTAKNMGSGSLLDADLWDGYQFTDYLNQSLRTSDSPTFDGLTSTGAITIIDSGVMFQPASVNKVSISYDDLTDTLLIRRRDDNTSWYNIITLNQDNDNVTFNGGIIVSKSTSLTGSLISSGSNTLIGVLTQTGNTTINGNLDVFGSETISNGLTVSGSSLFSGSTHTFTGSLIFLVV